MEFVVIDDAVEVSLGADEEALPKGIADIASGVDEEMICVVHKLTAGGGNAGAQLAIEEQAFPANAGHQVDSGFLVHMALIDRVEIVEDRAISLEAVVKAAPCQSCEFYVEAEAIFVAEQVRKSVGNADAGIEARFFRRRHVDQGGAVGLGGKKSAGTYGEISFLAAGERGGDKNGARG